MSYLRLVDCSGEIFVSLIMTKSRVSPLQDVTIPRLELVAATVSVKVANLIRRELEVKIDNGFFWTDSQVVLGYIRSDTRRFKRYVTNRVQLIKENSEVS